MGQIFNSLGFTVRLSVCTVLESVLPTWHDLLSIYQTLDIHLTCFGVQSISLSCLVDLLDGWSGGSTATRCSTSSREAARHATGHSSWHPAGTLVELGDDGVAHLLQLLLLMLVLVPFSSLVVSKVKVHYFILSRIFGNIENSRVDC